MSVAGWDGMAAIYHAIKVQNGKLNPDKTMAALKGWKYDSPRGPIQLDPDTRDIIQNEYIREVKKVDGALANVDFVTIPAVKDPWKMLNPPK
jgi:branched-chain amino acid transport system substrate-binding protein